MIPENLLRQRVEALPPLPQVAVKVLHMANDPDASAKEIVEVLRLDPIITMRVLRICNSAFYGLNRQVNSLQEAVVLIGLNPLVNIVLTSCVASMMKKPYPGYGLEEGDFWRHSVACAITGEKLALRVRPSAQGQAYTAGLLHDIGKIVLCHFVAEESARILEIVEKERVPFYQAEQEVLGYHHAQISGLVVEQWSLPAPLCQAIRHHHTPEEASGEDRELVFIIHLANILCLHFGYGLGADGLAADLSPAALKICNLTVPEIMSLAVEVFERYAKAESLVAG